MQYAEIMKEVDLLKKTYGKLFTNIIPGTMKQESGYELIKEKEGLIIIVQEPYRKRGYFAVKDESVLEELLGKIPQGIVFEWIYRSDNVLDPVMERVNIEHYATYIRRTTTWKENPYEIPDQGRRGILQKMYDPSCGEYAVYEDAEELCELAKSVFDVTCDDVFTVEQWKERINRREVLVYRDKNNRILSCYVWRIEGNRLYSHISINMGSANILYNMERRIHDDMWDKGIHIFCGWYNMKNKAVWDRILRPETGLHLIEREDILYNAIYKS